MACPSRLSPQQVIAPSESRAQAWSLPRLTSVNGPVAVSSVVGLTSKLPQHTAEPSLRRAQVPCSPLLMAVYRPAGGDACPCRSSPQHATEPLEFRAHTWSVPRLNSLNGPLADGGGSGGGRASCSASVNCTVNEKSPPISAWYVVASMV